MSIAAYRAATWIGAPVIDGYLRRRLRRGREDGNRFGERMGMASKARPRGPLVWIHAASVGEATSVLAVIERLQRDRPALSLLMTSATVTSAQVLADRLPDTVIHQYAPVDRVAWVRRFLDHWKPDLVLWVESEFWPAMLSEIGHRKVPAILINARLSTRSWRRWQFGRGMIRTLLRMFELCMAQTETDAERLRDLGAPHVVCPGNLKLAAAPLPAPADTLTALRTAIGKRPTWLAFSTHPGEEEILLDAHAQIAGRHPDLLTMIAPRHPGRGPEIAELARGRGLGAALRSRSEAVTAGTDILLADTIGELGLFFSLGDIALVGGSLAPHGGHNPIEAALLGCAILHGPHMENFRAIENELCAAGAATVVRTAEDIALEVGALMTDTALRAQRINAARRLAMDRRHILDTVFSHLDGVLDSIPAESAAPAAGNAGA